MPAAHAVHPQQTPLWAVLALTFVCSLSTGLFWNGIYFVAKHGYAFTSEQNLALASVMGGIYIIGAFKAGTVLRLVERWLSPRGVLAAALLIQSALCVLPAMVQGAWVIWLVGSGVNLLSAFVWPTVESYISSGRHGAQMRSAIGWFNITWTPAVALPLLVMGSFIEEFAQWTIVVMAGINLAAISILPAFARAPHPHDVHLAAASVTPEYPMLLAASRWLLPVSYVLLAAMTPILPFRFEALQVDPENETTATAAWMLSRVVLLMVMWRIAFWHGRWGTLLFGVLALLGGFATVVLAQRIQVMLLGFIAFGIGMGIVYYATLYYSMAVGRAEVDAGGVFEGLIGSGYTIGPLAALLGMAIASDEYEGRAIVGIVWAVVAVGCIPATAAYLRARRKRIVQPPVRTT